MLKKLVVVGATSALVTGSSFAQKRSNIVMFYLDDWAWNGSPVAMNDSMENSRMPLLLMSNLERLPELQAYYKSLGKKLKKLTSKKDPAVWLGMADDMDDRIGAVLDKLEALGAADNTYVVVVSDNGYRHNSLNLTGLKQPLNGHQWWAWLGCQRAYDRKRSEGKGKCRVQSERGELLFSAYVC